MTVLERVRNLLIRRIPDALCDDCIASLAGITPRQHANHKTRELAKTPNFDRRKDVCHDCGKIKKVTHHRSKHP